MLTPRHLLDIKGDVSPRHVPTERRVALTFTTYQMMWFLRPLAVVIAIGSLGSATAWNTTDEDFKITIPTAPSRTVNPIDPSFPNFAYEFASFVQYATVGENDTSPNQYSINLMNEIYKRSGGHPIIRIGGTSGDYAYFVPTLEEPVLPQNNFSYNYLINGTTFGPAYYPLTHNLAAAHAKYVPQISLASDNLTLVRVWTEQVRDGVGLGDIEAIEVGNEPNGYPTVRGPQFVRLLNNTSYTSRYKQYAELIASTLLIPSNSTIFQALDDAINVDQPLNYSLTVEGVLDAGINSDGIVKSFAWHYYQQYGTNSTDGLTTHDGIIYHMSGIKVQLDYLASVNSTIPFIISEAGVSLGPKNEDYQSVLATAVWKMDCMLYAMSIGVQRVHWQSIFNAYQSMWLPQASLGVPQQTWGTYYAMPMMAEFIGLNTIQGGSTRMLSLLETNKTTAYAAYDYASGDDQEGRIARVALIDLTEWTNGTSARPSKSFALSGLTEGCSNATVKYLNHPDGSLGTAGEMTYGGSQWTAASGGNEVMGVRDDTASVKAKDGTVTVILPQGSGALVTLNYDWM